MNQKRKVLFTFIGAMSMFSGFSSERSVVDAHVHLIKNPELYPWISPEMVPLQEATTISTLLKEMEDTPIDECILVQAHNKPWETEFLLDVARNNPSVLGVVGWVDLLDPWIEEELDRLLRMSPKLKGIRAMLQSSKDDHLMEHPDFLQGLMAVGKAGLTYDVLVTPEQLDSVVSVVQKKSEEQEWDFSKQRFVVDHMAKPLITQKGPEEESSWAKNMKKLAACPNVWVKVSGMVTETDGEGWLPELFYPYLDFMLEHFGEHRLLFGSDFPVCQLNQASYRDPYNILVSWAKERELPEQAQENIFKKNALVAYNL